MILKTNSKLEKAIQLYIKNGFIEYSIRKEDQKADCDVAMIGDIHNAFQVK